LLALTVLLAALAVAVNAAWLGTARLDLQSAADAASLAGAGRLVSNQWLRKGQPGVPALLDSARATARDYAALNRALGQSVQLQLNAASPDVVLGSFDPAGAFIPAPARPTLDQVEVVQVTARRLRSRGTGVPVLLGALLLTPAVDLQARAFARLDRNVIGFMARTGQPIPLVPIGVRSDPTGADPQSWENQVINANGPDNFVLGPTGFTVIAGGDGIPEMVVQLPLAPNGDLTAGNGYLLQLGTGSPIAQVSAGVSADDLAGQGGQLVLDATNQFVAPATVGPTDGSPDLDQLRNALEQLRLQELPRIFPLVGGYDPGTGQAQVTAFVAARVVLVKYAKGHPLFIRLQPTMLAVPQAITDPTRRGSANLLPSPYLAKARLVR
jgi:hypothetical protein